MTPKQERFSDNVVAGMSQTEAYRDAYDTENMLPVTVNREADRLMDNPHIATRIAEGNQAIQEAGLLSRADALLEAKENLEGARLAKQWGPANQASKQRQELSGLTQEQPKTDVRITQVTIVMPDTGTKAVIEAEEWTTE